ncbi:MULTISPECIES: Fe(3+)-hydroxamate ABC transporter permease FhuB [unclassified Sinorhizobium]|uniref:Fe(3+)-hydroxamate ABC transporter permease FhuB n=1 Tax=unclassified Sinorhizobium TaxID=2613772 RepID=UPI003525301C
MSDLAALGGLPRPIHIRPIGLVAALLAISVAISTCRLYAMLPPQAWWSAAMGADGSDVTAWVVHYSYLPRVAVSILAGAMLALAATIFQQVLRNPLAEPATLGVSAGASLAVTASSLWLPDLLGFGRESVAIVGASATTLVVFGLAWRRGLAPLSLILAGLIVGLYFSAVSAVIALFHHQALQSVFLWGAGSLRQNDWSSARYLLPRFAAGLVFAFVIARPLTILGLDDETGKSLGVSQRGMRLAALAIAVSLSAFVTSAVGIVGFIGLAAPAIARLSGARTVRQQLVWAPLVGGSLLWLTDQCVQMLPFSQEVPTGVGTAVLGAPILIWMLPRLKGTIVPPNSGTVDIVPRTAMPWTFILFGIALLCIMLLSVLFFGRGPFGWTWLSSEEAQRLLHWRWPRSMAALSAGAMLAVSGTLMQRLTANPMASPEALGVSSGAACGVILLAFSVSNPDKPVQILAATAGASICLLAMLAIGRKSAFSPDRLLLTGIAIGTAFGALVAILMASGDPRMGTLLSWMAGSTYLVTKTDAVLALCLAGAFLLLMPLFARWLEILPLGETSSRALGVNLAVSRLQLLFTAAMLTGAATLIVGPLSFVGLMAPHMARMIGLQRSMAQLYGSAVIGALIMLCADWLGRNLLFPYQVPAGLLATFIGGPYLMGLFWRSGR